MKQLFIKLELEYNEKLDIEINIKKEFKTNDDVVDYIEEQLNQDVGKEIAEWIYHPKHEYDDLGDWKDALEEFDINICLDTYKKFYKIADIRLDNEKLTPEKLEKMIDEYDS